MIFSLVPQTPCFCLFMWPVSVVGAGSEIYFLTTGAVNPVHVKNCLLLMAFSRVFCWSKCHLMEVFNQHGIQDHGICTVG